MLPLKGKYTIEEDQQFKLFCTHTYPWTESLEHIFRYMLYIHLFYSKSVKTQEWTNELRSISFSLHHPSVNSEREGMWRFQIPIIQIIQGEKA